ncbi:unnamed protein product [Rotaria magnacalcarata]|uniref:G-protein coupled receptors family 1 profile domain-containing protein n=1 Tax=Rotaria magnacalcarata TaxID=392030 RepID=A0A814Z135_9BILA|nr:unnamed protein product [Rotaria magnacalcarata]CAF1578236.1 unnamed protein product [Rotaria magnacalcarata]CAF3747983.1 unnamed protein product [Rotaria magnacalcarata]CAF3750275.1 unnamed protein product [Rotaria magnacalcarata]CAF3787959.1 unnamed protein product [Rotaria magnacalcarata]
MRTNLSLSLEKTCSKPDTHGPDAPFYHWLALGYVFLFILALTANLCVLFKLFHYTRRRFRDHILLLNLCAADLFVTIVYIPSEIYAYTVGRWHNDEICKAIAALKGLGIYVSSCTIIGISLDRYLSIVHPLTVYQSNTRNKLFVVGSWLISALIIFKRLTNEELCREMCGDILSSDPVKRLAYNIAVAIFAYIAPLIAIFYSYFRILYVLQRRCDRRTFRFGKCHGINARSDDVSQTSYSLKRNTRKSFNHERGRGGTGRISEQTVVQEEFNTHNMKTITRAKLKTLKLTVIIVICFILCWTPYYCIVFFLLITDARIDYDNLTNQHGNFTLTTPIDVSVYDQSSRDERSLLIVMMLAVSNSVLDPLLYGCYLVRPTKSNCLSRRRTRTETTTLKRIPGVIIADKESKLTTIRTNLKNDNHEQRDVAVECQL